MTIILRATTSLYFRLYSLLAWIVLIIVTPFFLPYCLISGKHGASLKQRFGFFKRDCAPNSAHRIWLHAASVGEVLVAKSLLLELKKTDIEADFILSTMTEQGQLLARKQLGSDVICIYAPVDLPWVINRFIKQFRPTIYICLETELWPNMLNLAKQSGVTTLLLNGRMSANSYRSYQKIGGFIKQVLHCFSCASLISRVDFDRYVALGLAPGSSVIQGNAKFDLRIDDLCSARQYGREQKGPGQPGSEYRKKLGIKPDQPILICGSTHKGEEELILEAYEEIKRDIPQLILIIAPRHIERCNKVARLLEDHHLPFHRLSQITDCYRTVNVLLVDTMGELTTLYSTATYVFCGGSLVDSGGHNIMEPAIWGKPPLYGPYMNDFQGISELFEENGAGFTVKSAQGLVDKIVYFNNHPQEYKKAGESALHTAKAQQGSTFKQAELVINQLNKQRTSYKPINQHIKGIVI